MRLSSDKDCLLHISRPESIARTKFCSEIDTIEVKFAG